MLNWARKLQCAAAVKHQFGLLWQTLMHTWAMKSDMGYDYVLVGYRRKTMCITIFINYFCIPSYVILNLHQGHFKVKIAKKSEYMYLYLYMYLFIGTIQLLGGGGGQLDILFNSLSICGSLLFSHSSNIFISVCVWRYIFISLPYIFFCLQI